MNRTGYARFRIAATVLMLLAGSAIAQEPSEVTPAKAAEHLIKKVDPEYPALAKAARVQGKVQLKATIAKDGAVTAVNVVSGHPMLVSSAVGC